VAPEELLVGLGETAAVFAGFSSIVVALGVRSVAELRPIDRFRFSNLLVISVFACLLAFVPIVLAGFALPVESTWVLASLSLALFSIGFLAWASIAARRVRKQQTSRGRSWMAALSVGVLMGILVAQCANALDWPFSRGAHIYVAGVFGLVILSGLQFILLALDSTPGRRG
jgi:hypothetical protein